jgi:hypothetical protein
MKTQISRDAFQPEQRYSGVYLQQGRMLTDADWNALTDIDKARLVAALRDAISGTNTETGAVAGGAPRVGGLRIIADPVDSDKLFIQPGTLYVEGVPARLDGPANLPINGQPDYPIQADYNGQSLRLYADVWERTVTGLEQPALLDAALHGADTATRTQTMVQVKWCPSSGLNAVNPLNPEANPPQGTGLMTLKLTLISSSADSCDPCAAQVKVDERIGNYLFRVEVHDVDPATGWLTLKWSRDNGAEACRATEMVTGFGQGDWVWEFFDRDTERLLGNHFVTNAKKVRGLIKETCTTPVGVNEPKEYVRQWDGYLRINLTTQAIGAGRDRGVPLVAGPVASTSHGRVNLTAGLLRINLERLELSLQTTGKQFVAGDYWLAPVREAVHVSGQYVLPAMDDLTVPSQGEPPRGVRHHYLLLGEIRANRKLETQDDAFHRRMHFPPLTDLTAADIGLTNTCPGLFGTAANVQQALDTLCAIGAEDIGYLLPACGSSEARSIKNRLAAVLDPDGNGALTVKAALDTLLCQLNAASLPYTVPACASAPSVRQLLGLTAGESNVAPVLDRLLCDFKANDLPLDKSDSGLCSDLVPESVATVQDALKVLCDKAAGGCAVVVTSPAHLAVLLTEFAQSNASDLWICLRGGTYPLGTLPAISGKRSLRISGQGPESVTLTCSGATLSISADEVILEHLSCDFTSGSGQLVIRAALSRTSGCRFARTSSSAGGPTMISLGGRGNTVCTLNWRDNVFSSQRRVVVSNGIDWADVSVVGDMAISEALLGLSKTELLNNKVAYDKAVVKVAEQIIVLPKDIRTSWRTKLEQVAVPRAASKRAPKATTATMTEVLSADTISVSEAVAAIEDLVANWISYEPDYALRLESAKVGGLLAGSEIDGWLLLANGVSGYRNPDAGVVNFSLDGNAVLSGGEDLHLDHNRITAIKANLPAGAVGTNRVLNQRVQGYARLMFTGNSIAGPGNTMVAAVFIGQSNTWFRAALDADWMGSIIGDRATFTGNLLENYANNDELSSTVRHNRLASTGNVLIELVPLPF